MGLLSQIRKSFTSRNLTLNRFALVVTALCFFAFAVILIININQVDLQFWDEATNVAVIAEAAAKPDWWNLQYVGAPFWEKPPLFYWLGVIFYKLGLQGNSLVAALRLLSLLAGLSLVGIIAYLSARKWGRRAGIISVLLFLATPFLWLFTPNGVLATHNLRSADADALQLLAIVLGYLAVTSLRDKLIAGSVQKKSLITYCAIVGVSSGIAVMLKGPFGLLPLLILTVDLFILWQRRSISWRRLLLIAFSSGLTMLLIVAPWHLYMYAIFGQEFIDQYLIYHQLSRAGATLEGHRQPFTFFVQFLSDPRTSLLLPLTLLTLVLSKFKLTRGLIIGGILLLTLSLLGTKLSWYSLYAVPFLIIYNAEVWGRRIIKIRALKFILVLILIVQIILAGAKILIDSNAPVIDTKEGIEQVLVTRNRLHRTFYYYNQSFNIPIFIYDASSAEKLSFVGEKAIIYLDRNEFAENTQFKSIQVLAGYRVEEEVLLSPNYVKLVISKD